MSLQSEPLPEHASWLPYFVDLLKARFGLVTSEGRKPMVQHAVERVSHELALSSPLQLLSLVRDASVDSDAVRLLLRHVTIHESYFFRDERAVEALRSSILPELLERRRMSRRLRVWSAGCSGGEEAFTISFLLRTLADLDGWNIEILGTDLDGHVVERARTARFSGGSLRACDASALDRYFDTIDDRHFHVRERYCDGVRFEVDNLMDPRLPFDAAPFDLVICRNVAIYFDREGAERLHDKLGRYLAPDGFALLGVLEPRPDGPLVPVDGYPAGIPLYCRPGQTSRLQVSSTSGAVPMMQIDAPRYADHASSRARLDAAINRIKRSPTARANPVSEPFVTSTGTVTRPSATRTYERTTTRNANVAESDGLERARKLADSGQLEAALGIITAGIDTTPLDTKLYLLGAIIADELRRDELSETFLRRAVYLEPELPEAHLRLSLLLERRGDSYGATRAMREARRLGVVAGARS